MRFVSLPLLLGAALVALACGTPQAPTPAAVAPPAVVTPPAPPTSFVNRVWRAVTANGAPRDELYVFLSGGTLVITSSTGTPMVGRWAHVGERVTMVEEGVEHTADILTLTADEFRIRSYNPGEPVELHFVPADAAPRAPVP
jgi:hypothetical protein